MPEDDDMLDAYERELAAPPVPVRRTNRGFWLVAGTLLFSCVFLVAEIFANRGIKDSIAHAEYSLRAGQTAATQVFARDHSFAAADAAGLVTADPAIRLLDPGSPSTSPDELSVAASDTGWAAAVEVRPGACFYLRLTAAGEVLYGNGTDCRATAALDARDPRW